MLTIKINNREIYSCVYGGHGPRESILPRIFSSAPNLQYWSEDGLRKFFSGTLDFTLEFLEELIILIRDDLKSHSKNWHQRETARTLKRQAHAFTRKLRNQLTIIPHLNRDQLLAQIYNLVLYCDKLETLRNFGMANQFGDKVMGNPERQSMRRKE